MKYGGVLRQLHGHLQKVKYGGVLRQPHRQNCSEDIEILKGTAFESNEHRNTDAKNTKGYTMDVGPQKTEVMTNNPEEAEIDISENCTRLKTTASFSNTKFP